MANEVWRNASWFTAELDDTKWVSFFDHNAEPPCERKVLVTWRQYNEGLAKVGLLLPEGHGQRYELVGVMKVGTGGGQTIQAVQVAAEQVKPTHLAFEPNLPPPGYMLDRAGIKRGLHCGEEVRNG